MKTGFVVSVLWCHESNTFNNNKKSLTQKCVTEKDIIRSHNYNFFYLVEWWCYTSLRWKQTIVDFTSISHQARKDLCPPTEKPQCGQNLYDIEIQFSHLYKLQFTYRQKKHAWTIGKHCSKCFYIRLLICHWISFYQKNTYSEKFGFNSQDKARSF